MTILNLMKTAESSPKLIENTVEKEKLLVTSNFSFSYGVFKRLILQKRKSKGLFGKGLINFFLKSQQMSDPFCHITECSKLNYKQDVFVKHECPRNGHFLRNVTFIFDLDLCR